MARILIYKLNFKENEHNNVYFCPNFIFRPDSYIKIVRKFFSQNVRLRGVLISTHLSHLGSRPLSLEFYRVLLTRVYGKWDLPLRVARPVYKTVCEPV